MEIVHPYGMIFDLFNSDQVNAVSNLFNYDYCGKLTKIFKSENKTNIETKIHLSFDDFKESLNDANGMKYATLAKWEISPPQDNSANTQANNEITDLQDKVEKLKRIQENYNKVLNCFIEEKTELISLLEKSQNQFNLAYEKQKNSITELTLKNHELKERINEIEKTQSVDPSAQIEKLKRQIEQLQLKNIDYKHQEEKLKLEVNNIENKADLKIKNLKKDLKAEYNFKLQEMDQKHRLETYQNALQYEKSLDKTKKTYEKDLEVMQEQLNLAGEAGMKLLDENILLKNEIEKYK